MSVTHHYQATIEQVVEILTRLGKEPVLGEIEQWGADFTLQRLTWVEDASARRGAGTYGVYLHQETPTWIGVWAGHSDMWNGQRELCDYLPDESYGWMD